MGHGDLRSELSKAVDVSGAKASLKANGQTRPIGGHSAIGYDLEISMQSAIGGGKDMDMTAVLSGPIWIVKNAAGSADFARFYKAAVDKGWIFSDPRGAKAQPGQAKAMAEMYRQMANIGGIPYATDVQIKMSGSGPLAGILRKDRQRDDDDHDRLSRGRAARRRSICAASGLQAESEEVKGCGPQIIDAD